MLFKRKNKLTLSQQVRSVIWPRTGWKRALQYLGHRTVRISDTAHSIALGLTIGCAVSWTPTFGTHLLQCFLFSKLLRANWMAAFIGSAFGNPWTFPLILWIAYQVGEFMLQIIGLGGMFGRLQGPVELENLMEH